MSQSKLLKTATLILSVIIVFLVVYSWFASSSQSTFAVYPTPTLVPPACCISCCGTATITCKLSQAVAAGDSVDCDASGGSCVCGDPCGGGSDGGGCSIGPSSSSCSIGGLDCGCNPFSVTASASKGSVSGRCSLSPGNNGSASCDFDYTPPTKISPTPTPTLPPDVTPTPTPTLPPDVTPSPTPTPTTQPGTISGKIWVDNVVVDGRQGPAESLYSCSGAQTKIKIQLYKRVSPEVGELIKTKWPEDGTYEFTNLEPGKYHVKIARTPICEGVSYEVTKWRVKTAPSDPSGGAGGGLVDVSDYCEASSWYTCADPDDTWTGTRLYPLKVIAGETTNAHLGIKPATCAVSLWPESLTLSQGETGDAGANVTMSDGSDWKTQVTKINFSSTTIEGADPVISLDPTQVSPPNCSTKVTGENVGRAEISVVVTLVSGKTCQDPTPTQVTVTSPGPWFRTQGGDVHAQGNISSQIPTQAAIKYFSRKLDGYPGVVSYAGTSASFGQGEVSSTGWLAHDSFLPTYSYGYFYQKLGSPEVDNCLPGARFTTSSLPAASGETEIYYCPEGPNVHLGEEGGEGLTIPSGRKIIILTPQNVLVHKNVKVTKGGFLAVITSEHINIDPEVAQVEGVYIVPGTDRHISTGTARPAPDIEFTGEGIFYAQRFALGRNLDPDGTTGANKTRAEVFIFRPDLVINTPKELKISTMSWQEVAP